MMKMIIDETYCKGCSLCLSVCRPKALGRGARRNAGGYIIPAYDDVLCTACGNCEWTCPEMAITVTARPERNKRKEDAQ